MTTDKAESCDCGTEFVQGVKRVFPTASARPVLVCPVCDPMETAIVRNGEELW